MSTMVTYGPTSVPGMVAAAISAGDQMGTLISLASAASGAGGTGRVVHISLTDGDDALTGADLFFFHDTPTLAADNAVWSVSDADLDKVLHKIPIFSFEDFGNNRGCFTYAACTLPYFCTGTTLYVAVRTQTSYTPSVNGLKYKFILEVD